ncbi:ABC transporter permease [Rhizobium rhizosphaerae]|uniref:ABC transporter permease n=1 Tax=Xaviernesmea rhizosphaerae TaxID=1672749 RepID=A0ABX3PI70_9HYPH|nr:ABC transporter permease [Xaviernesmea rhizosphaerae]OQP88151.1 ABC transporter permease [Xaviernesmea rhizosphaerae]
MADAALSPAFSRPAGKTLRALLGEPRVLFGGGFVLLMIAIALLAPVIAPKDPLEQDLMLGTLPPAGFDGAEAGYLLGTDDLGRDVLSRILHGTRIALIVAFVAASLSALIGTALGLAAGFYRGWTDRIVSRLVDIWMSFPPVLLSVLLVAVFGPGLHSVIAAIVIIDWTRFCRVVRAETIRQAGLDYVTAAETVGFSRPHILLREILPNVVPILLALVSLEMGIAVTVEAILSFVGLSLSSDTPTWGGMIAQGRQIVYQGWWVLVFPLIALFSTVLAFNQLGNGLRLALDPVMRR